MTTRTSVSMVLRMILGGLFIYAGWLKIADPALFAGNIAGYKLLPPFGNYLVAATLPWVEFICGLLLVMNIRLQAGATLVLLMNAIFIIALASAIIRGLDIDCGCFRQGGAKTTPWNALLRDVALMAGTLALLRLELRKEIS